MTHKYWKQYISVFEITYASTCTHVNKSAWSLYMIVTCVHHKCIFSCTPGRHGHRGRSSGRDWQRPFLMWGNREKVYSQELLEGDLWVFSAKYAYIYIYIYCFAYINHDCLIRSLRDLVSRIFLTLHQSEDNQTTYMGVNGLVTLKLLTSSGKPIAMSGMYVLRGVARAWFE